MRFCAMVNEITNNNLPTFSVSDLIASVNQTFEYAYPTLLVEGEVASFKVNQAKYVFFDLKDAGGSVGCFMTVWQLRMPIEDGMRVIVQAVPKLTQWGKFSLTIQSIRPVGEGDLRRSFEMLRKKLEKEGLFAPERKRILPRIPRHVGVISSTQAAGYADFIKILGDRWGGVRVDVAHTQVQGADAPDQIVRAIKYFNEQADLPEVLVIIRGGGSADDLAAFNDEVLVREIASSRIPTLVGVGHETDESLADLVADVRAATPSNAAQLLVPNRQDVRHEVRYMVLGVLPHIERAIDEVGRELRQQLEAVLNTTMTQLDESRTRLDRLRDVLAELDPRRVMERGYAVVRGSPCIGQTICIERSKDIIMAEVTHVSKK